jgi:hypothetical protein
VAVPAFLEPSSQQLNLVVNSQFPGAYLYPFDAVANSEIGVRIIGMQEETIAKETFWRTNGTKQFIALPLSLRLFSRSFI